MLFSVAISCSSSGSDHRQRRTRHRQDNCWGSDCLLWKWWFGTFETQIIDRSSSFTQAAIANLTLLAKRPSKPSKGPTDSKGLLVTFLRDVSHCFTMFGNACPSVFFQNMSIGEAYNFQQQLHLSTSCLAYNPAGTTAAKAARTLWPEMRW